ncbi:hypothetical protein [Rhizobium alarense]|nr:hypothetical protein [Rhizobium alarense]
MLRIVGAASVFALYVGLMFGLAVVPFYLDARILSDVADEVAVVE